MIRGRRTRKRIPLEECDSNRICDLYFNKMQSITDISRQLSAELPLGTYVSILQVTYFIKTFGTVREPCETMKIWGSRITTTAICVSCKKTFGTCTLLAKFCKECGPDEVSIRRLSMYGISHNQYNKMLEMQKNCCSLCQRNFANIKPLKNKSTPIMVDHNHETGFVRGLLCHDCNIILGYFEKADEEWHERAKKYKEIKSIDLGNGPVRKNLNKKKAII